MSDAAIAAALFEHLDALPLSPALPVAYPNVPFSPTDGAPWLRGTLLPAEPWQVGRSADNSSGIIGFLQVDVFYPQGRGEIAPVEVAETIMAHFAYGTVIAAANGNRVEIVGKPFRMQLAADPPWSIVPVRILWQMIVPTT